jgi:hypothetical protein
MPKKIKELDKIIEQILLERFPSSYNQTEFVDAYGPKPVDRQSGPVVFADLSNWQEPDEQLTIEDLQYLIDNPQEMTTKTEQRLIAIIKNESLDDDNLKALAHQALESLKAAIKPSKDDPQTVSAPEIRPQQAAMGNWPSHWTAIINRVFPDGGDFKSRLIKLSEISNTFYKASSGEQALPKNVEMSELFSQIMLLDVFNLIAKDFDAGSGGYLFEYLMALLTGGRVVGGAMGAVDFKSKDGEAGSSKYYEKLANMKQAITGFNLEQKVQYIIAIKKQHDLQREKSSYGTANPNRLIGFDVYTFDVEFKECSRQSLNCLKLETTSGSGQTKETAVIYRKIYINGKERQVKEMITQKGELNVSSIANELKPVAFVQLAAVRTESYRQMINRAFDNSDVWMRGIYKQFVSFFDQMTKAKQQAKIYATEGDLQIAESAQEYLNGAVGDFTGLKESMSERDEMISMPDSKLSENNVKTLDKLIERVILDKMED